MVKRSIFSIEEREFISDQLILRFNTLTKESEVHSVPIWFTFDGSKFYFRCPNIDAKRWRNLKHNPKASVELDSYESDGPYGGGILVYGRVQFLELGQPGHDDALSLLRKRYKEKYPKANPILDSTLIAKFEPSEIMSWITKH